MSKAISGCAVCGKTPTMKRRGNWRILNCCNERNTAHSLWEYETIESWNLEQQRIKSGFYGSEDMKVLRQKTEQ